MMKIAVLLGSFDLLTPNMLDAEDFQHIFGQEYQFFKTTWATGKRDQTYNNALLSSEDSRLSNATGYAMKYDLADDQIPLLVFVDAQISDVERCLETIRIGADCERLDVTLLTLRSNTTHAVSEATKAVVQELATASIQGVAFTVPAAVTIEDRAALDVQHLFGKNLKIRDISTKLRDALEHRGMTVSPDIARKKIMRILRRMTEEGMLVAKDKHEIFADELAAAMMQDLTQFLGKG
jgi:hypothetical protein